jgi:hypothetical protein
MRPGGRSAQPGGAPAARSGTTVRRDTGGDHARPSLQADYRWSDACAEFWNPTRACGGRKWEIHGQRLVQKADERRKIRPHDVIESVIYSFRHASLKLNSDGKLEFRHEDETPVTRRQGDLEGGVPRELSLYLSEPKEGGIYGPIQSIKGRVEFASPASGIGVKSALEKRNLKVVPFVYITTTTQMWYAQNFAEVDVNGDLSGTIKIGAPQKFQVILLLAPEGAVFPGRKFRDFPGFGMARSAGPPSEPCP